MQAVILSNDTIAAESVYKSQILINNHSLCSNLYEIDSMLNRLHIDNDKQPAKNISLNVVDYENLTTIKVPINTVKTLGKIHNISPPGSQIKFYFNPNKPTKIESAVDTYGTYIIFLRDIRN